MDSLRTIPFGSFPERLAEVELPLAGNVREALVSFLHADKVCVGELFRQQKYSEHAEAQARETQTSKRVEENRTRLQEAEKALVELPYTSALMPWVIASVSIVCFIVCFGAEYVFNRAVVPWLVSVSPRSLLGMALSVAPATAPIVLDRVFLALFDVHDTWEVLKSTVLSPVKRSQRIIGRIAFFLCVGALNVSAIWTLADSRGIASHLKNDVRETVITTLQQNTIDKALLLLSIAITVDGALFYLFGLHECRIGSTIRQALTKHARLVAAQTDLEQAHITASKDRSRAQHVWEAIDGLERSVSEAYFAENMVRLAEVAAKPGPIRSAKEVVIQRLNGLLTSRSTDNKMSNEISLPGANGKRPNGKVV